MVTNGYGFFVTIASLYVMKEPFYYCKFTIIVWYK